VADLKKPKHKVVGYLVSRAMSETEFQLRKPKADCLSYEKVYSAEYVAFLKARIAELEAQVSSTLQRNHKGKTP